KFDFTFSNIQANQVPKGWDKIYVSLISSESGKTVRKSGKVAVKNGTCQWTETFAESIWISDIHTSKQMEEYLFKFLVATGSSKSSILGETALNLAAFLSSESPVLVSLPLKKCSYGTVLQVEVKCLTPKTNPRDEKWKGMHAAKDENVADHDSIENQSVVSDSTTAKSSESLSSNNVVRPMDAASRETSFSASVSRYSFDSMDDSVGRQSFSSQSERFGGSNVMGRQDSIESNESASYSSYSAHGGSVRSVRSHQSPFMKENHGRNQREEFRKSCHAAATSLQLNLPSSRDDATVQELEAEARMWEQNARKLAVEMERLRDELSDQNLNVTKVNMELAASRLECQELTQEIEQLKSLVEESEVKQNAAQNSEIQELGSSIQKELEDEIRFQKEENENLCLQLDKTQESNIELISVLQEMEETIDKQKIEIERLSANKLNRNDQISFNDGDLGIYEMSAADVHEETPRENSCTVLQELQRALQGEISTLESAFQEKIIEIDIEEDMKNRVVKEFVVESNHILAEKEQQIMNLEAALSSAAHLDHVDGRKEIKQLKEKVGGLEADCSELTEENLELLYELEELRKIVSKNGNVYHHNTSGLGQQELCIEQPVEESEKTEILQEEIADLEDMESIGKDGIFVSECSSKSASDVILISSSIASHEMRLMESENNQTELMKHLSNLQEENIYLLQCVSGLEAQLRYLTDRSESSRLELQHSVSQVMILENQIKRLEEENESQMVGSKEKLLEMQNQWLEAEEERISLGEVNIRLQAATESIMEEYNSLQKFNGELREQKLELQSRCMALESRARTFQDCRCSSAESTADLRVKCSLLKEEVQNLERSDKENKAVLTSDQEKLLIMFESMMDSESKLKSIINELDSNLELSEVERLRLAEENSLLHMQLEKASELQSDILALRVSVQEIKSQNQQLQASLKSVSRDYEEAKHEKVTMVEKIYTLQRAVTEEKNCRLKKNALEEKILRLEGDLIARDALSIQDAEMKNELNQIKIVNSQLLMKVKHLENAREEGLEHEPKQTRKAEEICSKSTSESHDSCQPQAQISHKQDSPATDYESRILLLENELARALQANGAYKSQLESDEAVPSKKSTETNETGKTLLKISQLEAELQEIQDRYFQMSLNYAEVEAEREQLVMKLRALNI
ncbi:hypothetical protein C2S53_011397, partial [Perilla frutescens var. hirtella]